MNERKEKAQRTNVNWIIDLFHQKDYNALPQALTLIAKISYPDKILGVVESIDEIQANVKNKIKIDFRVFNELVARASNRPLNRGVIIDHKRQTYAELITKHHVLVVTPLIELSEELLATEKRDLMSAFIGVTNEK